MDQEQKSTPRRIGDINPAADISMPDPLDLLSTYVDLVREDLARGDIERVLNYLRTICVIGAQIEQQLRLGIGVDGDPVPKNWRTPPASTPSKASGSVNPGSLGRPRSPESSRLSDAIIQILSEGEGPVSLKDLMDVLQERAVPIPGQGKPANLIAHMKRMSSVERVGRGVYALRRGGDGVRGRTGDQASGYS